ncbi:uncharacterized protein DEA37_0008698 [Paragonimus westermani]|uniref:Integrase catalytic domain-containing protein n=1 Tax=Paragonimus westermani TaxID=34504 RepID=A0A5J4NH82_9TREM|nr:uncharacterized protein DEA37_0008698 [Paragonimus westermani]
MVAGLSNVTYESRLEILDLCPLEFRRLRGDLISTHFFLRINRSPLTLSKENRLDPGNLGRCLEPVYQSPTSLKNRWTTSRSGLRRFRSSNKILQCGGRNYQQTDRSIWGAADSVKRTIQRAPIMVHSDQAAAFERNRLLERTYGTIEASLQSFLERHQADRWDELSPRCTLAYRASIHSTIRYTPANLTFGRELGLPFELFSPVPPSESLSQHDHVKNPRANQRAAVTVAQGHKKHAQRHQKDQCNQHISGLVYPVSCFASPKAGVGEPAKLHHQCQGPYKVASVRLPTVHVIQGPQSASSDVLTVHSDQLKPTSPILLVSLTYTARENIPTRPNT